MNNSADETGVRFGGRRWSAAVVSMVAVAVVASVFAVAAPTPAAADTAPTSPNVPETVSSDPLPTVQINGVVWDQVVVGDRVYATGQFTQARPGGRGAGPHTTPPPP